MDHDGETLPHGDERPPTVCDAAELRCDDRELRCKGYLLQFCSTDHTWASLETCASSAACDSLRSCR
jgi:hypothetical protein